jgi:hypothetical protein
MLAELQAAVASALRGGVPPAGVDAVRLAHARRALAGKRSRAAARLLPELQAELGQNWRAAFRVHAGVYSPCGLLHHIDDAWQFALAMRDHTAAGVRLAAARDLRRLRGQFLRSRRRDAHRIRVRNRGLSLDASGALRALATRFTRRFRVQ